MYIEKNGYVIMNVEEMNFYDTEGTFSENIEEAELFTDLSEVNKLCKDLSIERDTQYEVVRFSQTIWLDKCFTTPNEEDNCCCGDDCCRKESQDIDDFGIKNCSLEEAIKQQQETNELLSQLSKSSE